MTAVRIVARIVDAACFPFVLLVRAIDAVDTAYANALNDDTED